VQLVVFKGDFRRFFGDVYVPAEGFCLFLALLYYRVELFLGGGFGFL
jgi:hypothetical protein